MTESTMTITHVDESVTITSEEAKEIRKNLKDERLGKLSEERKEISDFISSIYEEAENKGFDKKALKLAIK